MHDGIVIGYVVLLLVGGWMGFAKAGSRISLISSGVSAALLLLFTLAPIPWGGTAVLVVLGLLLVTFAMRLKATRKFMPAGLMCALTTLTLAVLLLLRPAA